MALSILDGNQSATTLSTILSSGQHIPAHTVVSLGTQAITDMRGAVSGSVVSISNLPATQPVSIASVTIGNTVTIAGTVTANDSGALSIVNSSTVTKADVKFTAIAGAYNPTDVASSYTLRPLAVSPTGKLLIDASSDSGGGSVVGYDGSAFIRIAQSPQSVVTIGSLPAISGTVTVGNTVAISGTVTANPTGTQTIAGSVTIGAGTAQIGSVTASNLTSALAVYGGGNSDISVNIKSVGGQSFGQGQTWVPVAIAEGSLPAGTAQIGSVTASISNSVTIASFATSVTARLINPAGTSVTYAEVGTAGSPSIDVLSVQGVTSGTAIPISISSVTIGSLPAISGTVTANTFALQGTAVTTSNFTSTTASTVLANFNAGREVLTIFNEGAGNLHICAGATCTTIAYQVRLSAGDYYEVPNHQTTITHSAVFATAGTARVTEVS